MSSVARALLKNRVKAVFGIPGTHTVPIYRGLQAMDDRITTFTTRHESGAGYAADGYARATGELAAVCVVTGIGLTNTLTPMAAALADSVPMLVISSEVPSFWSEAKPQRQYSHYVPRCDDIAAAVSKRSIVVTSVMDIEAAVTEACALARGGRPGPVHLSIPIDVLAADAPSDAASAAAMIDLLASGAHHQTRAALSAESLQSIQLAAAALRNAERPVIIAGGGSRGAPLAALAEALNAPVLSTVAGKGAIDERHPLSAGARLHHPPTREALLSESDHVLLLGTQLSPTDYWQFKHHEEVPIPSLWSGNATHVDLDPRSLAQGGVARNGGVTIEADATQACAALIDALSTTTTSSRFGTTNAAKAVAAAKAASDSPEALTQTLMWDFGDANGGGKAMLHTLSSLRNALPDDTPVVSDVCRLGYTALSKYPAHTPNSFLYPVGTTALGYGLPAAVGAAIGRRLNGDGGPVALLVGDGGLQMSMQELAVAAEEKLPLLLVVWNDGSYGEIRRSLPEFATTVPRPDMSLIAAAYGIDHIKAVDGDAVEKALASPRVKALLDGSGGGGSGPVLLEVNRAWDAEKMAHVPPQPVLGTMTFGWSQASRVVDTPVASEMLRSFVEAGGQEVDTARMYAGGETERILADAIDTLPPSQRAPIRIATKANPAGDAGDDGTGGLSATRLSEQLSDSLTALRAKNDQLDTFYLHWPDTATPLDETLEAVQQAYESGRFKRLGLSNYAAGEVQLIHERMSSRGWVVPTCFQGMYNALTRDVESELLPLLRELNMSFYAYNPLAGGLLTGKHQQLIGTDSGRFADNTFYQERYWKRELFAALDAVRSACDKESDGGLGMAEAAIRWMSHHSALDGRDGLILGASSVAQLEANLSYSKAGPLPEPVVKAWEDAWEVARPASPRYDGYGVSGSLLSAKKAETAPSGTSPKVTNVALSNGGAQIELSFIDGRRYKLHAGWLRDSSPAAFNESYVRRNARRVRGAASATVTTAQPAEDGSAVLINFGDEEERFDAGWLHACAPYVGQAIDDAPSRKVDGAGYLLEDRSRNVWRSGHEVATFDAQQIYECSATAVRMLETMETDGVAVVHNAGRPRAFDLDAVGEPVKLLAQRLVGKLYSHPRRRTAWGFMREKMETSKAKDHLADYNFEHPLSMHTDHAFIDGVPGYLQFMYQAQGSVTTQVVDGVAVAEELRRTDPEAFRLLSTVPLTHSLRTIHYDANGDYCHLGSLHDGVFEDCHTHPIIELDAPNGRVARVAHSEIKRGVCAIPYDVYHDVMAAYTRWLGLLEDKRFVVPVEWPEHSCIVINNHRVMHTRASPPKDGKERIMVWAYAQKHITELRYRLLKQQEVEREGVSDAWTTRLPNQIVGEIASQQRGGEGMGEGKGREATEEEEDDGREALHEASM